jgi:hypothetical protein
VNNNFIDFAISEHCSKRLGVKRRRRLKKWRFFFYQLTGYLLVQQCIAIGKTKML